MKLQSPKEKKLERAYRKEMIEQNIKLKEMVMHQNNLIYDLLDFNKRIIDSKA
jgi:hypothetical protein